MTDSSDRKTLTLKPGTRSASTTTGPRQRSGARAWKVARTQAAAPEAEVTPARPRPDTARDERRRPDERARPDRAATSANRRPGATGAAGADPRAAREPRADRRSPGHGRPEWSERSERPERAAARPPRTDSPARGDDQRQERRARHADRDAEPRATETPVSQRRPRGSRHLARDTEIFAAFAPCPQGLEAALATELTTLGYADVAAGRGGAHFRTDWSGMMRANLHSRLATRILIQIAQGPVAHEDDLLALAHDTPWERWFGPEQTLRVDTSAIRSPMQSLQYCTLRVKDGICDRLRDREGDRPSIDTVRPDARVHVFLNETTATLYLDTSGESLFKRGWRLDKGEAPLRENLAAGLLALAEWPGDAALLDPFCGSGTILIEAAYQALRVPPGINRPFAFERLRHHDDVRWRHLKDDARRLIRPQLTMPLLGSDSSPQAIASARANAARAGLTEDAITFEVRDAIEVRPPHDTTTGWIITNPPYGSRLALQDEHGHDASDADIVALWHEFSKTLKGHFDGWHAHIITTDRDLPKHLRLAARKRTPIYNGALDCRLFAFDVVTGTYRQRL